MVDAALRIHSSHGASHLLLPDDFMASTVSFGRGELAPGLTVGSTRASAAAATAATPRPSPVGSAVLLALFYPLSPAYRAASVAAAAAALRAASPLVLISVSRQPRGGAGGDADALAAAREAGEAVLVEARAELSMAASG